MTEEEVALSLSSDELNDRSNHSTLHSAVLRVTMALEAGGVGALIFLVILVVIFQSVSGRFLAVGQLSGVFMLAAGVGAIGAAVALLMISGEFDLSVGATYALVPIVMGELVNAEHWNSLLALIGALLCAAVIGLANGLATTKLKIPSFIVTLASLYVLMAITLIITNGLPVSVFRSSTVDSILGGAIGGSSITAPILWTCGFVVVLWFLHARTRYGNWCRAAGAPGSVGRALGVPVARVKIINFVICSTVAGFSGCAVFAQLGSVDSSFGTDYNLLAIIAAVLGGTSLFGVEGSVIGAFIGAVTLGSLETGLLLVNAPSSWYDGLIGLLLVIAVLVNDKTSILGGRVVRGIRSRQD